MADKLSGRVWKYGDDIDTDRIIPARYLNTFQKEELARHCLEDLDPAFAGRVQPGDILVAGKNFGCGSSREHAPLALQAAGVSAVIAASFARIFYRNAINIGLPILACPEAVAGCETGDELELDLAAGTIYNKTRDKTYQAAPFPRYVQDILNAGGLPAYVKRRLAQNKKSETPFLARIAVLKGDGVGPEVVDAALLVLRQAEALAGRALFSFTEYLVGGAAIDREGTPLPPATLEGALASDAVLLGAVGGPRWDSEPPERRPERGLLELRRALGVFANLRPVRVLPHLSGHSPLKPEVIGRGADILFVRELTGGAYFGAHERVEVRPGEEQASDALLYTTSEIRRVVRLAFHLARSRARAAGRRARLTSVDKANVLATSLLWREVVEEVAAAFPEVEVRHLYVDACAMRLVAAPQEFDVIVTENLFGDILSDLGGALAGSLGLLPSASLGEGGPGLYEPVHGSAPGLAGLDKANPVGAILAAALMLRYSLNLPDEAAAIEAAVAATLSEGIHTPDLASAAGQSVGTQAFAWAVAERLERFWPRTRSAAQA
ncbi:MAG: 3-isopropylmalate dehydrogenase [Bacillota bacterium]|nr:3-isopropylmalate dehydrogenase [Bacillota bacterium]